MHHRLDTLGHAAFSYDFGCLAGGQHALAEALDGLTNNENNMSSFYMKALFWLFPSILGIGRKGQMIKRTRNELGSIVMQMWKDGKNSGDANGRSLMSIMREFFILHIAARSKSQAKDLQSGPTTVVGPRRHR